VTSPGVGSGVLFGAPGIQMLRITLKRNWDENLTTLMLGNDGLWAGNDAPPRHSASKTLP
jgi:hypothetical protein